MLFYLYHQIEQIISFKMVYCTLKLDGQLRRYRNFHKMAANHPALSLNPFL